MKNMRQVGGFLRHHLIEKRDGGRRCIAVVCWTVLLGWLLAKYAFGLASDNALAVDMVMMAIVGGVSWISISMSRLDAERIESDRRYRSIISNINEGFCVIDPAGRILEVNEAYCRMSGYSSEELLAMNIRDLEAAESSLEVSAHIGRIIIAGGACFETRHKRKSGEGFFVEVAVRAAGNHGGVLIGFIRDISSRKKAEEELRQSEEKFRQLAETIQDVFWSTTPDFKKVLYVSPAYEVIWGRSRQSLLDNPISWIEAVDPADKPAVLAALDLVAQGTPYDLEYRIHRPDGSVRWLRDRGFVVRDAAGSIRRAVGVASDITERKRSEAELESLRAALEQAGESIFITDPKGIIQFVNPAFEASTGFSRQEAVGKTPRILKSGKQDAAFYRELWETISSGRIWRGRIVNKRKNGSLITEESTISSVRDADGRIINYVAVKRDITEKIRLENELRQSQKMETVGRLAGGIAHDFNNILTAINGYTGFAMAGLAEGDQRREDLKEVLAAGERATRLTRQLLAFSRKQILNPQVVDINASVGEMVNMLKRLIGEDIALETKLAAHPCLAKVDAGQIEQVFLNLAINARDAMPKGGNLSFETAIVPPTETFLSRHPDIPRGPLVCLSVRDTGCGMTEEIKSHLFEPFFTTKEKGKGSGLGLSMVYGIIKQSGGDIEVESAPDQGTTFRIYFSQAQTQPQRQIASKDKSAANRGHETILLVDDEDLLRRFGERALSNHGYTVLTASSGKDALKVIEQYGNPVDLLITDVVMPGMSGRELAQTIAAKNMTCKTLYISGYTDDAIVRHGVLDPGVAFLYKPFDVASLLRKTRETLDGPPDKAKA